jgi:hypothetical protein
MRRISPGVVALVAGVLAVPSSLAAADSFTPITVALHYTPIARLHAKFQVKATITADPGVLDIAAQPVRIGVKLATECGSTYETTTGPAVLNQHLKPQPAVGRAYSATITGAGRPAAYGTQTLCMFIEDSIGRVYANDESQQVTISKPCTTAGSRYDKDSKALTKAQRQLRRAKSKSKSARKRLTKTVNKDKRTLARDRRKGVAACGKGVPL